MVRRKVWDRWLKLQVGGQNWISHGNERVKIGNKFGVGLDQILVKVVNKKITSQQRQAQVLFTGREFIYRGENITIGGVLYVRLPSWNVWISRLPVVTIPIGYLSTPASNKSFGVHYMACSQKHKC